MNILSFLNKSSVSVAILLYISFLAITVPYGFPLFGLLSIAFVLLKFFTGRILFKINYGLIFFVITVFFYIFGVAMTGQLYESIVSDVINIIGYMLVWILLSDVNRGEYKSLLNNFAILMVINGLVFAPISIFKFIQLTSGVHWEWLYINNLYPSGTSLVIDYNMFSLSMLASALMALYMLKNNTYNRYNLVYIITALLCFSTVALAGSRRGWILLFVFVIILAFILIKKLISKQGFLLRAAIYLPIILLVSFLAFLVAEVLNLSFTVFASEEFSKMKARFDTIQIDSLDQGLDNRTIRWEYAWELIYQSNIVQLFIGSGFEYLTLFSENFGTAINSDYPHNPILSSLLYSGLIGTLPLMILLIYTALKAFKPSEYRNIYLSIIMLIAFVFVFISANSIFSIKPFFVLMLIILSMPTNKKEALT